MKRAILYIIATVIDLIVLVTDCINLAKYIVSNHLLFVLLCSFVCLPILLGLLWGVSNMCTKKANNSIKLLETITIVLFVFTYLLGVTVTEITDHVERGTFDYMYRTFYAILLIIPGLILSSLKNGTDSKKKRTQNTESTEDDSMS